MDKHTNFSISGGACAPSYLQGIGDPVLPDSRHEVDKEFVKRLLREFDIFWGDDRRLQDDDAEMDYFFEMSEVWNGR